MTFLSELERRNVLRVMAAYIVAAWLIIQVVETVFPAFGYDDTAVRIVVIILAIGLIIVAFASWALEITPEGLRLDNAAVSVRDAIPPGRRIEGPAIIAESATSTIVTSTFDATVDAHGSIVLDAKTGP